MKTFKLKDLMITIQPKQAELTEHFLSDCESVEEKTSCSPPSSADCDDDRTITCTPPSGTRCDEEGTHSCSPPSSIDCDDDRTSCSPPSGGVEEKLNSADEITGLDELKNTIIRLQAKANTSGVLN
jgi:hypothetical protein